MWSRRQFFELTGRAGLGICALQPLALHCARAAAGDRAAVTGFGELSPARPENTDDLPARWRGRMLLELPPGFRYTALSIVGETMNDGYPVPGYHDGMAAFPGDEGRVRLVRNHEIGAILHTGPGVHAPAAVKYDPAASGGATTLVVSPDGRLIDHYGSLAGTMRNCAGGPTPWGTWISCEEDVSVPGPDNRLQRRHGYAFEVDPYATDSVPPVPLTAMGRFRREAVAVDSETGAVFQSEDRKDGAFYRFRPSRPGGLAAGGTLEALAVRDRPGFDTGTAPPRSLDVHWVRLEEVDPLGDTLRAEARHKGAAIFRRGEGVWAGNGRIYFACTSGGAAEGGQIFALEPRKGLLRLLLEVTPATPLDRPDNLTLAPDGTLYICEDSAGVDTVVGLTRDGGLFRFARNAVDASEFAGGCFAPDGSKFFVNAHATGITYCIWGPWPWL